MLQPKCSVLLKFSPVRALRISMGVLIAACLLLPILCSSKEAHPASRPGSADFAVLTEVDDWKAMHPDYLKSSTLPQMPVEMSPDATADAQGWTLLSVLLLPWSIIKLLLNHTPTESIFGLCIPSVLIAALICSSHMSRRAATLMSYATLLQSQFDPASISSLYDFIDNFAAVVVCTVLSVLHPRGICYHFTFDLCFHLS